MITLFMKSNIFLYTICNYFIKYQQIINKLRIVMIKLLLGLSSFIPYMILNKHQSNYRYLYTIDDYIPFIPSFVFFYFLMYLLVIFLIIYESIKNYNIFGLLSIIVFQLLSAIIFLFFQTSIKRPNVINTSGTDMFLLNFIYEHDSPFNCFPSGHVGLSVLVVLILKNYKFKYWYIVNIITIFISLSVLFIKQHVIVDILGGGALAFISYFIVKKYNDTVLNKLQILKFMFGVKNPYLNSTKTSSNAKLLVEEVFYECESKRN